MQNKTKILHCSWQKQMHNAHLEMSHTIRTTSIFIRMP